MRIDSHQHFWRYDLVKDAWISDDMKVIQQDFLPADLLPLLRENNIDGCIAVQADQSEAETHFLLQLAEEHDFIKGVVGWVDFRAENIKQRLKYFSQFKKLKGFRHIIQGEAADDFLLQEDFCNGIAQLEQHNFTYDLLIAPQHLKYAIAFVKRFPKQSFVIDHLAKPNFKEGDFTQWEKGIAELATYKNVVCKLSGMVTEADWNNWKQDDFSYCLDVLVANFGVDRLLFGSDWPVTLLAATYEQTCGIVESYFSTFPKEEQDKIWSGNAIKFYHL
ncbi:amidohydrolase family protein [Flavobacterium sp. TMP13]|uniref:amidohydrolase family protein n=1 Tax=unclassified Flavobacterium TaxID=196869 RepID=UPI00076DC580|nr:amidohydrolase family protein [Flavobacterium sp. TAB 87]KVV16319.1 putative metal-dependent hydrolase of the TIM-barrel fold protein [Flavobacterium sp. TAB 87]